MYITIKGNIMESNGKNIIITSALPYANGEIHLGHIVSTYLPADIFARFCRSNNKNVVFTCATDDFGTPILLQSEKEKITPEKYIDFWNKRDLADFTNLGISFDFFHNTSSTENIKLTQYFFQKILENNLIYKNEISQLYCEQDKKYLPDRYVLGTCPYCNEDDQYSDGCEKCGRAFIDREILKPRCAICNKTPKLKTSMHYFFKLSLLSSKLKTWLTNNSNLQNDVKNYVMKWIDDGLNDWDITRDISWGVPIPLEEAKNKVLYGWFDNHICYISSTLLFLENKNINGKEFWNNSIIYHFIGKDIVYHHYLFLSAMRLAINEEYKLPEFIPTRGHLMLQGEKFSKSRGWYIGLREFLDEFPADYLRFYLARITPFNQSDVNFDWEDFAVKINNELVANVGNFIHRILSFIESNYDCTVPEPKEYNKEDHEFLNKIRNANENVTKHLEKNEIDKGITSILNFSDYCNQYFQKREPWKNEENKNTTLYLSINAVLSLSILLFPYIPFSIEKLLTNLNIERDKINWKTNVELFIKPGHKIKKPEILFKKIEKESIEKQKNKLGKKIK